MTGQLSDVRPMKWMKWPLLVLVLLGTIVVLLKAGFFEKVFGPWAAWAQFIGYFD